MLDLLFGSPRRLASDQGFGSSTGIGRQGTRAGVSVNEETALTYSAVWCATRIYCESVSTLPLFVYRRLPGNNREQAADHSLFDILKIAPNEDMGSMAFREGRTMHQLNLGNGFAEIELTGISRVAALHPIHASRVRPTRGDEVRSGYAYAVRNDNNSTTFLRRSEMLHIPGIFAEDGIWGKGVITHARESIGFGLATERHGSTFFGDGGQAIGILSAPGMANTENRRSMRAEWKEVHTPGSREIAIFPPETKYTPISISNEDSQFIETRQYNISEIARWYNLPPHMLKDLTRSTFSNIEHQGLEFVIYSLLPVLRRWEEALSLKLLTKQERAEYFIEFLLAGLLRGDFQGRMAGYQIALINGIMTINEVRRLENLNSIGPAGDQHFVQLNMTTAERMLNGVSLEKEGARKQGQQAHYMVGGAALLGQHARLVTESAAAQPEAVIVSGKAHLADTLDRMFAKEANAVRRHAAKLDLDFEAWLTEFHAKHVATLRDAIGAAVTTLNLAGVDVAADALAGDVIGRSRSSLVDAYNSDTPEQFEARLSGWSNIRTAEEITILFAGD